ncbi:MAG: hypothetical protein QOH06_2841 [Acidobacteriota bacterium]|jgi:hypothetical protein|nr:hypothetical protein [Acidobacteriota bacterium]
MSDLHEPPDPPQLLEPPPECPQHVAEIDLGPYLSALHECIASGWQAWELFGEIAPALRLPLTNRTRANFIYDHITTGARARFADLKRVKISENRGFLELLIASRYIIRFKKLNKSGRSSNIQTKQQLRWFSIQLELPDMPPAAVRLIAGYQLNLLGTEVANVLVTRPVGSVIEWSFSLADSLSNVKQFPVHPPKPATTKSTRKTKKDEKGDD